MAAIASSAQLHGKRLEFLQWSPRSTFLRFNISYRGIKRFSSLETAADGGRVESDEVLVQNVIRKPISSSTHEVEESDVEEEHDAGRRLEWMDWEDQILEDTVPLVGLVRMILHSTRYKSGDRLSLQHEKTITERLLPYHPGYQMKVGCGIDYLTVDYHPEFEETRCLFIVRKDGEWVDFSYWKCLKGLIRDKYPLYADNFILRHFRRYKRND